jgi:hypothetical protein
MISFLTSRNRKVSSGHRKASSRRANPAVEHLEHRLTLTGRPSLHLVDLMNDHVTLAFPHSVLVYGNGGSGPQYLQLVITNENVHTGEISGEFDDPNTGVQTDWSGKLTWASQTKHGYPVDNLVFSGGNLLGDVSFSGTVDGPGTTGAPFGNNDKLSGELNDSRFFPYSRDSGQVSGTDIDPIRAEYKYLGGVHGSLGRGEGVELATPVGSGFYQRYKNGAIFWSQNTGTRVLSGPIWDEYEATGNVRDCCDRVVQNLLGLPTSNELNVPGVPGALMNTFQGGTIYWAANTGGAHAVYGAIGDKYNSLGGPAVEGLPTSDEQPFADNNIAPVFRVQAFQNDSIYWSSTTGHTIYGAIGAEWASLAHQPSFSGTTVEMDLGQPTNEETDVPGVSGARVSTFENGAIYWTPNLGAHVVYGSFSNHYNQIGGPTSFLGLPINDPLAGKDFSVGDWDQYFQNGSIVSTPQDGVQALQLQPELDYDNPQLLSFGGGNPINARWELKLYQNGSYDFSWNFNNYGFVLSYDTDISVLVTTPTGSAWFFEHTGYAGANNPLSSGNSVDQGDQPGNLIDAQLYPEGGVTVPWQDLLGAKVQFLAHIDNNGKDDLTEILAGEGALGTLLGAL